MGALFSMGISESNAAETKRILNTILKEMFSRTDLVDLYSMADPAKCSKYIVATSSALEKVFAKINLYPGVKDGEYFFQKLEGIEKANPNRDKQSEYCKQLSFFFIRIFQIYAAITLTIIDSELPDVNPESEIRNRGNIGRRVVFYNRQRGVAGVPKNTRPAFRLWGGAAPLTGSYALTPLAGDTTGGIYARILNKYLSPPGGDESIEDVFVDGFPNITILQDDLYANPGSGRTTKPGIDSVPLTFIIRRDERDYTLTSRLYLLAGRTSGSVILELRETTVQETGKKLDKISKELIESGNSWRSKEGNKLFNAALNDLLESAFHKIDPPPFNANEFLARFSIIRSRDGRPNIEGTNVIVENPEDVGGDLDVTFTTTKVIESRSRNIKIYTTITIERGGNRAKGQEYTVSVNFNEMKVMPEDMGIYVNIEDYDERSDRWRGRWSTFTTGTDDRSIPKNDKGETIPVYLQRVFKNLIRERPGEGISRDGIKYRADGTPIPFDSDTMSDSLRIKWLWDGLRKNPPVKSHCVARAMQLLNLSALRDANFQGAMTSVCNTKFAYVKDNSLPQPGGKITTELGVRALATLFVKLIDNGMKTDDKGGKFSEFKKRFLMYFQRMDDEPTEVPSEMSDIKDLLLPGCAGKDGPIPLNPDAASNLRTYGRQLMSRQAEHVTSSMNLIFMLFNERAVREGRYELSEYVLQGGMEAVNNIGERARILLSEYFGSCEKIFKDALYYLHFSGTIAPATTPRNVAATRRMQRAAVTP